MSLLTVGSVAFDTIETPFGVAERIVGGSCTYISYAASYFTKNIQVSAVIGSDFPETELTDFRSRGIDLSGLDIKQDEKSFFWHGRYHTNMNSRDTLETQLNVLADFQPVLPESYKNAQFLMLGNLTPDIQMSVIKQMAKRPKFIALDTMNFWMDIALNPLLKVLKKIDLLIINEEEARQLSNVHSIKKAANKILALGPKFLIIKKGEHGAMLFYKDSIFFAPGLPLEEVFDPTGAGDTFAGGFMGYLAAAKNVSFDTMKRAIIYGSALASFCVEKFGAEGIKNLTREQIEARAQEFTKMVKVKL